jgi:hypothetical protein
MTACPFAESLGKPGEGIHSVRLGGLAVVDVAATLLGAWLLAPRLGMPTWAAFLALVCLGVLVHWALCVDTAFNRFLGLPGRAAVAGSGSGSGA